MRFFIVDRGGTVLDEFEAESVFDATSSPEWERAPLNAMLVELATSASIARRRVGEPEIILQTSARAA